jgi:predicted transcriptional regulator
VDSADKPALETPVLFLLIYSKGAISRRKILTSLLSCPKNCNQLSKEAKLEWWSIKKHLEYLCQEKLIKVHQCGRMKIYEITSKGKDAIETCNN